MFLFKIVLILLATINMTLSLSCSLEFEEDFHPLPCMPDGKYHLIDTSNLTLISDYKNYRLLLNGSGKWIKDMEGVIKANFTAERKNRMGQWETSEFISNTDDACGAMNDPFGQPIVYSTVQRAFKQKRCPIRKGNVETFNMFSASPVPVAFPCEYLGEWRAYARFYKNDKLIECHYYEAEIFD